MNFLFRVVRATGAGLCVAFVMLLSIAAFIGILIVSVWAIGPIGALIGGAVAAGLVIGLFEEFA